MTTEIANVQAKHYEWLQKLTQTIYTGVPFTGLLDYTTCSLGTWLNTIVNRFKLRNLKIKGNANAFPLIFILIYPHIY